MPSTRRRSLSGAAVLEQAVDGAKEAAAKVKAREYVESLKNGKKVEVSPVPTRRPRRNSRTRSTPEMNNDSDDEEEEEEEETVRAIRSRASSRSKAAAAGAADAAPVAVAPETEDEHVASTRSRRNCAVEIGDTMAAVESAASVKAAGSSRKRATHPTPEETTPAPSSRVRTPVSAPRSRSPAPVPVKALSPTPKPAPALSPRQATSVSPKVSHKPPMAAVTVNASAAIRRRTSLSPTRAVSTPTSSAAAGVGRKASNSAYAGTAGGAVFSSSPTPAASRPRATSNEGRAMQRARELLGSPVEGDRSSSYKGSSSRAQRDFPVEIHHLPAERPIRGVRFTDGGSPGQPPLPQQALGPDGLPLDAAAHANAEEYFRNQPVWAEYMDVLAVLFVALFGAGLLSMENGSSSGGGGDGSSTGIGLFSGGGPASTCFYVFTAAAVLGMLCTVTGTSNFLMSFIVQPNSNDPVHVASDRSAHMQAPTSAPAPEPAVSGSGSGSTASILRNSDRRLSAGHTPGKALVDRGRSVSPVRMGGVAAAAAATPAAATEAAPADASPKTEVDAGSILDMVRKNLVPYSAGGAAFLVSLAYLSYPGRFCVYCCVGAVALGGGAAGAVHHDRKCKHGERIDGLAWLVKHHLRTTHEGAAYPAEYLLEELKEACQFKHWPSGTPPTVRALTPSQFKAVWDEAMRAVKEDRRVVVTEDTRHGVKLEHLRFIGETRGGGGGVGVSRGVGYVAPMGGIGGGDFNRLASTGTSAYQYAPRSTTPTGNSPNPMWK